MFSKGTNEKKSKKLKYFYIFFKKIYTKNDLIKFNTRIREYRIKEELK